MAPSIELHAEPRATIPASNVYFAFCDGDFEFDCVTCGAQCCRGFGFFASKAEATRVATLAPGTRHFMDEVTPNGGRVVSNFAPGCFF